MRSKRCSIEQLKNESSILMLKELTFNLKDRQGTPKVVKTEDLKGTN